MKGRALLTGVLVVLCAATLWGVWDQRSQLAGLRAEQQHWAAQLAARQGNAEPAAAPETGGAGSAAPPAAPAATPELLRLRSEVTRLTERRRELADVRAENEALRAQLASRGTNGPGGFQLPPGYIRKRDARMMGFSTPDDTLQTLLWAVQNHDLTNVLQAFTPEQAEAIRANAGGAGDSSEEFWSQAQGFVGMRIVKREQDATDGSITVEIEVLPGEAGQQMTFRQVNGQWRIAEHF